VKVTGASARRLRPPEKRRESQIVGNIGMFYACYRLSKLGWNVMPTARNARGIDIIAYSPNGSDFIGVQVKALSKGSPVPLGLSLEKLMGQFWIIVTQAVSDEPVVFVMTPAEVRERAHRGEKEGRVAFWLQPRDYNQKEFREAWHRLDVPSGSAPEDAPSD
jgi:hypothetical protein